MVPTGFFSPFLGPYLRRMEVPRLRGELELSCWSIPQPQQWWIWTTSATCASACSSAAFLSYWARPGIKPTLSRLLEGFFNLLSHNGDSCFESVLYQIMTHLGFSNYYWYIIDIIIFFKLSFCYVLFYWTTHCF